MRLDDIYRSLEADIREVERELTRVIQTDHPLLNESANHLLVAGGKRMRPVFSLLAGKFGRYDLANLKKVAVPLELIHMATLVHDDVIDNAETRRGQPTVKTKWDNRIAMYTGDYILGQALSLAGEVEDPRVHQVVSKAVTEMCLGEIEQIRDFYRWEQTTSRYLRRIKRKTALLIAVSFHTGALVSEVPADLTRRLHLFGYYMGMAFQLTDDVLDFTGDDQSLGKPAASDLRQGNITLPVIYAIHCADGRIRNPVLRYVQGDHSLSAIDGAIEAVRNSGGISYTNQLAQRYLAKGFALLEKMPACHARDLLEQLARFIEQRSY
ncbi:polyprenyl synthetase family protein [Mechercharimyces sp. CAU 1602]|nr:polyprenyl synthetase family protein [Mechercharimyces sp. CAU 1602]